MRIYVGNLSEETSRADLRSVFAAYGKIGRVGLAKERPSGTLRGYGLVEMKDTDGRRAIIGLHGRLLNDRPLKVREVRPRADRKRADGNPTS